ncbi:hypothetical protein KKB18_01200 [bacterium]|nr:hypothetical protein [bacterium]
MENQNDIQTQIKQIDEIIPPVRAIKTLKGENIVLPIITLGMELRIMRQFFEFLKAGGYQDSGLGDRNMYDILLSAFCNDDGNKLILDMFALIVGKPVEWLLDNVDISAMAECLLPFFVIRIKALTGAMGGMTVGAGATRN